ncbi:Uncharacterized protein YR821_1585 [Yersinia ruckeri]|uniref:Uncharacterized protein n=1 Tax=Yersinia ruckeri TaxID=29486 RepID=A0A0A8VIG8_YERRU|nr:hypothetical protein yruck0001_15980 [Yersinia ruckeri ATCC 29473]QTD76509.1 Uncharacterized protein YR821_1585 [Yersinia ruckeri]CEK27411.1 hypothetical protein CSF007_8285 [Yersinia ruckeri]
MNFYPLNRSPSDKPMIFASFRRRVAGSNEELVYTATTIAYCME